MSTPRDTDESRSKPSVWPVYVAAGMVGVIGLNVLSLGILGGLVSQDTDVEGLAGGVLSGLAGALGALGVLGVLVAWGLFRLRPWAWWCVVLSIFVLIWWPLCVGLFMFVVFPDVVRDTRMGEGFVASLVVAVPLLWALVTRQQLFFPLKPEGEE